MEIDAVIAVVALPDPVAAEIEAPAEIKAPATVKQKRASSRTSKKVKAELASV